MNKRIMVLILLLCVACVILVLSNRSRNQEIKHKKLLKEKKIARTSTAVDKKQMASEMSKSVAVTQPVAQAEKKIRTLKTPEDAEYLFSVVKEAKGYREKEKIFNAFSYIKEEDKQLEQTLLNALDSDNRDVRTAAIIGLGRLKCKEAAPKLREIVKSFGRVQHLEFKAMEKIDQYKALDIINEAATAAQTLGELKDEEAIPILVDKYEELGGFSMEALAKIGVKALPDVLKLAREEKDVENRYACWALRSFRDEESKPIFEERFKDANENPVIRDISLDVLILVYKDRKLLKELQTDYEKLDDSTRYAVVDYSNQLEDIPFLIWILKNTRDESDIESAIINLGKIKDLSVVPALEECLDDRRIDVRQLAASALKEITGNDYDWHKKN